MSVEKSLEHRGCRIAYEVQGSGPSVLLIQGVGAAGGAWRPQVEGLADRYTCLWFDNRGMGLSQPAGCRITVEQSAGVPIQDPGLVNTLLGDHLEHG